MIKVTVWSEFSFSCQCEAALAVYPKGHHETIKEFLNAEGDIAATAVTMGMPRARAARFAFERNGRARVVGALPPRRRVGRTRGEDRPPRARRYGIDPAAFVATKQTVQAHHRRERPTLLGRGRRARAPLGLRAGTSHRQGIACLY